MTWNWQQNDWPRFTYNSPYLLELEAKYQHSSGILLGTYQHIIENDKQTLAIEIISNEALKTSEIEGEYLDRNSIMSSIRKNFGLDTDSRNISPAEQGIAEMMMDLYHHFADRLTPDTLHQWHRMIVSGRQDLTDIGQYRTHKEPMQVVSGRINHPTVHFEAPPSDCMLQEMAGLITPHKYQVSRVRV